MANWNPRANELFLRAVECASPAERQAFLDEQCDGAVAVREQVESLLAANAMAGSFLNKPALQMPAAHAITSDSTPLTEKPGTLIGPYKLLQQIGEGGMGVVYMAEQETPVRRRVALKIIKPGMDSAQVISRFEAERQALAMMDHQNIARVLDAGTIGEVRSRESGVRSQEPETKDRDSDSGHRTPDGRPFFVMELVHGVPITKYCDDNHLTPRQRLELFVPVCQAVQHAHQKGIIHRDLKPSNVMVCLYDGKPVPKIIDFGVAKATEQRLTDRTLFTQYGTIVGTFEYMAPEQAEASQLGVDTRSDIYSLGVLLYELLTGTTPLERQRLREAAYGEIVRLIKEEEPVRPSLRLSSSGAALANISRERGTEPAKLANLMRGELDWIVLRCLEKDRARRYETANGLARDVEHYLKDEPVEACPPTAGYRLRKFARKNQKLLATAAAFATLLVVGVAGSTWHSVRATQAETAALANEQRANDNAAQALANEQQANVNAAKATKNEQEAKQQRDEVQKQRDEVRELNDKLQRTLYISQMNLAKHAWDANSVLRVVELLDLNRPKVGETDLRGFEWFYLNRLCHSELLTLDGQTGTVVFSPDGTRLASASGDGTAKVWDARTWQVLLSLKHSGIQSISFSPDSMRLASASPQTSETPGEAKIWDAQTGKELFTLKGHTKGAARIAFSPDGKRLASSSWDKTAKIWDAQTGQDLLTLDHGVFNVGTIAFSPDGTRLATGSMELQSQKGEVKIWNTQTGREILTLPNGGASPHSVAFSPDGTRLAIARDNTVRLWDAANRQELLTVQGHTAVVWSVAFSQDGKRLATASWDKTVKVWDAETGQELLTLKGHTATVTSVAFSPDGLRLASGSYDKTVKVWDATANQGALVLEGLTEKGTMQPNSPTMAFSPDGKRLAGKVGMLKVQGNGMLKVEGEVTVWDVPTGKKTLTIKENKAAPSADCLAFNPEGTRLASVDNRGIKVWDAQNGQEILTLKGNRLPFTTVAFSPDGKRLATGGAIGIANGFMGQKEIDGIIMNFNPVGEVKIWDAQNGQEILTLKGPIDYVFSLAFSPDGKRLAGCLGKYTVKVWDAHTGQELLSLKWPKGTYGAVLAFSPDGKRVAANSGDTVQIWDAQTGQELVILKGHIKPVMSLAFSPDGKRLATASEDMTVKVWDVQSGQETLTLKGHAQFRAVTFSADGHRLIACGAGCTIMIWGATPLADLPNVKAKPEAKASPNKKIQEPPPKADFGGIDPKTVAAWEKAGAEVGWIRDKPEKPLWFQGYIIRGGQRDLDGGKQGDLPTFKFFDLQAGKLAKLPVPTTPFGLYLYGTGTEEANLKEVAKLKSLHTLVLNGTKVTDAGLKELAGLKSLHTLSLVGTQVTDAGLKELVELKSLQMLLFDNTKVTDAGLKELAGLKSLQALALKSRPITDAGLKEVAGHRNLHTLGLLGTKVTDAGLKELAGMKSLERLNLGSTQVTDAGLKELAGLTSLKRLNLSGTKVTAAGVAELQKALPNCEINNTAPKAPTNKAGQAAPPAAKQGADPIKVRLVAKKAEFILDRQGMTAEEYRAAIKAGKIAPPDVNFVLEITNTTAKDFDITVIGSAPRLTFEFKGQQGLEKRTIPRAKDETIRVFLKPGEKYLLPISRLVGFSAMTTEGQYFWTEPGVYSVTASFETNIREVITPETKGAPFVSQQKAYRAEPSRSP